ncbi:MAG: hypothetical protein IPM24_06150 [Bryobacterales bacterium]|nr:hypothetical protein [Bryobacterales bacterium]
MGEREFVPHPGLSDDVNSRIIQSEIEGGVYLDRLPAGACLRIETQNRSYLIVNRGRGEALICGHPRFCPRPVAVRIGGSTWGGSMLKAKYIGRGMHLEFFHPDYQTVTTSKIIDIRDWSQ